MELEQNIRLALDQKKILLMTHLVLGYPSFETNRAVIKQMVENGVDLIELQIPFSEPMADGPVILKANQEAIAAGVKVRECLALAAEMTAKYQIPFLIMTYYNILYRFGLPEFMQAAKAAGIRGFIVPDLPPEEGGRYLELAKEYGIEPIMIFAPTSTEERMRQIASVAGGFIYCVARRGVTGKQTSFDSEFYAYLDRCRQATNLPLAVGFGISDKNDVDQLSGRADIAVIGTQTIKLVEKEGADAVGPFIAGLR